ncbi:MAG: hypothetical protein JNL28_16075 [Planctomycetes bacterium]|nr:hypothetical protein [Planctomycetota bacterium]
MRIQPTTVSDFVVAPRSARLAVALSLLALLAACAGSARHLAVERTQPIAQQTLDEWCALLEPEAEARAWQAIPWQTNFHAGLAAAAEAQRPLLLWLMNGHPLGCT